MEMIKSRWNELSKTFFKNMLLQHNLNSEDLATLLQHIGVNETKASIDNKISRGKFSFAFALQSKVAIDKSLSNNFNVETDSDLNTISEAVLQYHIFDTHRPDAVNSYYKHLKTGTSFINIKKDNLIRLNQNKVISLFTGAGGLDIGLEQAGFETSICIEIDPDSRETLRYNRPDWVLFEDDKNRKPGDIRDIEVDEVLKLAKIQKEEAALVVGGAPCQPFSNIGKKGGKDDPKNGDLFLEFVRFVKGALPKGFIFENVVGITQSKHNDVINYMKDKLSGLGYSISYTILNAANYGVPQKRLRFFLIGIKGKDEPAFPLPLNYSSISEWNNFIKEFDRNPDYDPLPYKSVGDTFANLPTDYKARKDYTVMNISEKVVERMKLINQGENFKVLPDNLRPNCWKNGKHQGQDTFGRLKASEPSVTIRTAAYNPAKGKYIHPFENRGLDTIEMAALQSFPYDWRFKTLGRKNVTLVSAGRQIGNAVPPLLAKAIGEALKIQMSE